MGKKQQKCYCGSEKCRGYLGVSEKQQASKGGMLDYIWEDDSSDNDDDDDDDVSDTSEDDEKIKTKKNKSSENQTKDYDVSIFK